jgi:hypothetical protein
MRALIISANGFAGRWLLSYLPDRSATERR